MGRLEVRIRHGHDGGGWGPAVALILLIAFAAGGAGHKQVTAAAHTAMTVAEVAAWTLAALVLAAAATGVAWAGFKVRAAVRAARSRRTPLVTLNPGPREIPASGSRPAIGPASHAPRSWPLARQPGEACLSNGGDDDRRDA